MQIRVTHILPKTHIRRERLLPNLGKVLVRVGQRVTAADVLAETKIDAKHRIIDIGRALGVSPERADQLMVRKLGEQVAEGDIIAGPLGTIITRSVRAPKAGSVAALGGGEMLLELDGTTYQLRAGFAGEVTDLIPEWGAIIECNGAMIQGMWGNGREESGILIGAASNPKEELVASKFDINMRGAIVYGGFCSQADALRMAAEIPVRGLILAGIVPELIPMALKAPYPLLVIEGFGKLAIDATVFKRLAAADRRDVFLSAKQPDHFRGIIPEIIIPETTDEDRIPESHDIDIFAPGQSIRVAQASNKGKIGTLVTLLPGLTSLSNGLHAPAGLIRLDSGEQLRLPLANLEIIE